MRSLHSNQYRLRSNPGSTASKRGPARRLTPRRKRLRKTWREAGGRAAYQRMAAQRKSDKEAS